MSTVTRALTLSGDPLDTNSGLEAAFLADRMSRLEYLSRRNFDLAILCLVYLGVNLACFIINSMPEGFRASHDKVFHLLEFWATFFFSCVQVYALVFSPRSLGAIYSNATTLKVVVFFDVVATFVPALLVAISLEFFEVLSHELEYINEITMSFVDLVLIASVGKQKGLSFEGMNFNLVATIVALVVALTQLGLYNLLDGTNGGPGEQIAHFFEFAFEIISAFISFTFCMDNKFACDLKIRDLIATQNMPLSVNGHDPVPHGESGRL